MRGGQTDRQSFCVSTPWRPLRNAVQQNKYIVWRDDEEKYK